MPLFGHRENLRRLQGSGVPGLSDVALPQGCEPAGGQPFAGLHEADVLGGAGPGDARWRPDAGPTAFSDAYRGTVDGRTVLVSNAWTSIATLRAVADCAVGSARSPGPAEHAAPPAPGLAGPARAADGQSGLRRPLPGPGHRGPGRPGPAGTNAGLPAPSLVMPAPVGDALPASARPASPPMTC